MIITPEEIMENEEFDKMDKEKLKRKLKAIEDLIRSYTNNNFQNPKIRFTGNSQENKVYGGSPYLKQGDTVQISDSGINDGLYVITAISPDYIEIDREVFECQHNMITKVEYPETVKDGVLNLMLWEVKNRGKVGVKSETISRHSVTYYDQDAGNQVMGYPAALMGFLEPYMKARF